MKGIALYVYICGVFGSYAGLHEVSTHRESAGLAPIHLPFVQAMAWPAIGIAMLGSHIMVRLYAEDSKP